MKEGWKYKTLGEVGLFISGYTPKKNELNSSSGTPYFKVSDMNRLDNQITMTYSDLYIKTPKKIFPKGCIVFPKNGGAIYTEKKRFLSQDSVIDLNSEAILADENYIIKEYLFYFLSSIKISSFDNGGGLPSININRMKECSVPLPNIDEQRRIVSYLDSSFKSIDEIKDKALKSLTEAKALSQSALAEAMEPKEGWEEKTLGDVGSFKRGGNFTKRDFIEDGFPCVHYGQIHMKFGHVTKQHLSCVPKELVKKDRCAKKGDLIIAITSEDDEGSCKCTAWMANYEVYVGGHTAIYTHNLDPIFMAYYFQSPFFQKEKLEYTHGFKVVEINPKDIAKISIAYPPLPTQKRIVSHLDSLSSKVRAIEEKCQRIVAECDAMKQAMLREVFE